MSSYAMRLSPDRESLRAVRDSGAITSRLREEAERFESVLADLSRALARVAGPEVDREIEKWLGRICNALDLDRSGIFERSAPGRPVSLTHRWVKEPFPADPAVLVANDISKSALAKIMAGEALTFSRPSDLPLEMEDLKRWVETHGPKAGAFFPLVAGDQVLGIAAFGKFRERQWSRELLQRLGLAVSIFASAIERKRAEQSLQRVEAELMAASRRTLVGELAASIAR